MALREPSDTQLGAWALCVWVAFAFVGAYAIHGSMPHNALRLPGERRMPLVLPEGWKFFTRDPQEPRLRSYLLEGAKWRSVSRGANAEPRNAFGLNRLVRTQGVEMALLLSAVPDSSWTSCDAAPETCLGRVSPAATVRNPGPLPILCGSVGFAKQKPVPWAWANRQKPVVMPSQVLRLEVQCGS